MWNAIVSERIRVHGADQVVPGDLVFEEEPAGKAAPASDPLEVDSDEPMAVDEHGGFIQLFFQMIMSDACSKARAAAPLKKLVKRRGSHLK